MPRGKELGTLCQVLDIKLNKYQFLLTMCRLNNNKILPKIKGKIRLIFKTRNT